MDPTGRRTKRETTDWSRSPGRSPVDPRPRGGSDPEVHAGARRNATGRTPVSAPNEAVGLYEMDADDTFSVERHVAVDSSLGLLPELASADSRAGSAPPAGGKQP